MPGLSDPQYAVVLAAAPVALLVLDADLVMQYANAAYLRATDKTVGEVVGHYVFDVFPDSPDREDDQARSLEGVLRAVLDTGESQVLSGYRYDIPLSSGGFETRYWDVIETPLLDETGRVAHIVHYTDDVTELVRERDAREAAGLVNRQLQERVSAAQADLRRRADELEVLNARLQRASEHDRSVAEALQQAMLTTLPSPERLRLTAHYRAAAASDRVGGDWYDAIARPDGGTTVMIGDVVGHDIEAAALMGQLRSMLRAFAWATEEPPSAIMRQLDRVMRDLGVTTFATAVLATLDPLPSGRSRLRWTNAGHPAPVVVAPDGTTTLLDDAEPTVMLGVLPDTVRPDHEVELEPGSAVLFYTDGLVEVRGIDLLLRLDALRQSLSATTMLDPDARIERIIDDLVGAHPDDDIAVLLVELQPSAVS